MSVLGASYRCCWHQLFFLPWRPLHCTDTFETHVHQLEEESDVILLQITRCPGEINKLVVLQALDITISFKILSSESRNLLMIALTLRHTFLKPFLVTQQRCFILSCWKVHCGSVTSGSICSFFTSLKYKEFLDFPKFTPPLYFAMASIKPNDISLFVQRSAPPE